MAHAAAADATLTAPRDRSFLWRRLHSLSGVVPVGGYLVYHLYENMAAIKSPRAYDVMVNNVNTMLPRMYFHALELGLVLGPLFFHALYGLYIATTGKSNAGRYPYASSWEYAFQRISGYVAFVYILVHVGVLRVMVTMFGQHLGPYDGPVDKLDLVTYNDVAAHLGNPNVLTHSSLAAGNHILALYVVGTLMTIWHFTNGLNGFCWTWGIAVGPVAQKRVKAISWALFAALSFVTLHILYVLRFTAQG